MDKNDWKQDSLFEGKKNIRALLVGVYLRKEEKNLCEEHLDELERLADTYGLEALEKIPIMLKKYDVSTYLTKGKMEELRVLLQEKKIDLLIFDDEITPSQQRNLEKLFECVVIDRTEVILEVFAQRAQTKEARIQVELAKVKYSFPRLKRLWTHLERQTGGGSGGVFLKGMGEKQIEVDRRLLKKRMRKLEGELKEVRNHRETQRLERSRNGIVAFAIIGYTNSGKSTLLRALTEADVFIEDKLFATLDTTTRKFALPNNQEVLLVDTVGFIRKIPHSLIAAFKSTLEEAVQTDILLHLVDVSHSMAEEQAEATYEVLRELNASEKPIITVLNKIDRCENLSMVDRMRVKYPRTVSISALKKEGFEGLTDIMIKELSESRRTVKVRIPQSQYELASEMMRKGKVIRKDYEDNDILMFLEMPVEMIPRMKEFIELKENF